MIDLLSQLIGCCLTPTFIGLAIIVISANILNKRRSEARLEKLKQVWNSRGKDVVTLHMFSRGQLCPNPSPFPIKLELFLNMAKIKYVPDFDQPMSSKGKSPWITINGVDVADSQLAIEYLMDKLGKDIESGFSNEEKAKSRVIRIMIEEHFYWAVGLERWQYLDPDELNDFFPPNFFPGFLPRSVKNFMYKKLIGKDVEAKAKAQGMGRHSKEEVYKMGFADLDAMSALLGNKPYFLGDRPSLADVSMFGFMSLCESLPKTSQSKYGKYVEQNCPNLLRHHQRIVEKYWPDYKTTRFGKKE